MAIELVADQPCFIESWNFDIVSLVRIFPPAWPPPTIRSSLFMNEDLIHTVPVDIEIKPPIGMMIMIGVAGESPTVQHGTELAVVRQVP